jgi:hypothetical protein
MAGRGGAAIPCTAAAGGWGKMERRPRGIDSRAHLVLWLFEGAAPRAGRIGGGGALVFKREGARSWRCGVIGGAVGPYL